MSLAGFTVYGFARHWLARPALRFLIAGDDLKMYAVLRPFTGWRRVVFFTRDAIDDFRLSYVIRPIDGRASEPIHMAATFFDMTTDESMGTTVRLSSSRRVWCNITTRMGTGTYEMQVSARWHGGERKFTTTFTRSVDGFHWPEAVRGSVIIDP